MKNKYIIYILYGILGGLMIFMAELLDVYFDLSFWVYLVICISISLFPMLMKRLKKGTERSFSTMFRIGIIVSATSIISFSILTQIYPRVFISASEKTRLVDEKVNRLIMDFKGDKIDIFALEQKALNFFEPTFDKFLLVLAMFVPFFLFCTILFALILKKETEELKYPLT